MLVLTADQVAWAIVAACRETKDDPIDCISGVVKGGLGKHTLRGRHYAMHALLEVFPDLPRAVAARLVGAPGNPMAYYYNSFHNVSKIQNGRRYARWWDEDAFQRVVSAVRAAPAHVGEKAEQAPAPRPFISERQAAAYRMLEAAAANTAKLQEL
ncbi:hypothetical protein [Bradyrhizobium cenepequi]